MKVQIFIILILSSLIFLSMGDNSFLNKPITNDYYNYIAVNEIMMWISNNGSGSHDPYTDRGGFYWPGGINSIKSPVFLEGLIWGGYVNDSIQVNGNSFRYGLQAGRILPDGSADNPDLTKYRVFKIKRDWELLPQGPERDVLERDYNEWPVEDGAPWVDNDGDSIYTPGIDEPEISGDELLWYVSNDLDSSRCYRVYGGFPIGLEFQVTTYGYKSDGDLGDVVFKKYLIINKGENIVENMILNYWVDHDLGDANDDYVGGDSLLDLGFGYNGYNVDGTGKEWEYGSPPPAVGYHILQGPISSASANDSAFFRGKWVKGLKNLAMSSFAPIVKGWTGGTMDPEHGTPIGGKQMYNNLRGYNTFTGSAVIDPNTGKPTTFILCGDPVAGTGWYEGPGWPNGELPYDRRMQINSGPFTLAPEDTNEIVFAIIMAIGDDYLDSVTELKKKTRVIREFYYTGIMSGIEDEPSAGPSKISLYQNYPNPFNPSTTIEFSLSILEDVKIEIFNVAGQKIGLILNKKMPAGTHRVEFNGSNLASGVYFYQIKAGQYQDVKKMVLLK